jgi:hypothetical protein
VTAFPVSRVMVIFWLDSSVFSSAAAPAEPCRATVVCWVTFGRYQVADGMFRGPRADTSGRAASMKLSTSPMIGSGMTPRLSDVF